MRSAIHCLLVVAALLLSISCNSGHDGDTSAVPDEAGGDGDGDDAAVMTAGNAPAGSPTLFDSSGEDIYQHSGRPWEQAEFGLPRSSGEGCAACSDGEFCDRDHCALLGRGGIAYLGGTYGWECIDDADDPQLQQDPRASAKCGVHRCFDGLCRGCQTDEDCCWFLGARDPSCVAGPDSGTVCVWWERIQSNACIGANALTMRGLEVPR